MKINQFLKFKEIIFLLFILISFFLVGIVFYTELNKNKKIDKSKKNFYLIKKAIINNIELCKNKSTEWEYGGSCKDIPDLKNIINYYNKHLNLINPHDNNKGIQDTPGSVIIFQDNEKITLSVDIDANGGIDLDHTIFY